MQFTRSKKVAAAVGAGAIAVAATGVAYAYYSADIQGISSATGAASVSSAGPDDVTAALTTGASGLVPGGDATTVVVTLTNSNPYYVNVSGKTLTLDVANLTGPDGCADNTVALLSADTAESPVASIAGDGGTADVTFHNVKMADNATVNQTDCIGGSFDIPVTVADTVTP